MKALKTINLFLLFAVFSICATAFAQFPSIANSYLSDQPSTMVEHVWISLDSSWVPTQQSDYDYGPNSDLYREILRADIQNGTTTPFFRETKIYNLDGQATAIVSESYLSGAWANNLKISNEFDSFGNQTSLAFLNWNSNQWDTVSSKRFLFTYNGAGLVDTRIEQVWANGMGWADQHIQTYIYNSLMEVDSIRTDDIYFSRLNPTPRFLETISSWHNFAEGEKDSTNVYSWDSQSSTYQLDYRVFSTYLNNTLRNTEEIRYAMSNPDGKFELVYDSLGNISTESWFQLSGNSWVLSVGRRFYPVFDQQGRVTELEKHEWYGNSFQPTRLFTFDYFVTSSTPLVSEVNTLEIGPNPATSFLNIRTSMPQNGPNTIQLFDLQGRLRMETTDPKPNAETQIQLPESLAAGSYILVVKNRQSRATAKVQIIR